MSLSSLQLDAFLAVCRERSFSKAAARLHVTQSALSQRISALEADLQQTLLIRDREGARLTAAGQSLLRYCQAREALEDETLRALRMQETSSLGGTLRVAGYSSILRSVLMPSLAPLLRANPGVRVEFSSREMSELPAMLQRGETDYVVLDTIWERAGVRHLKLGEETNVLVESARYAERSGFYLDHDADDSTTETFLRRQKSSLAPDSRCYMDDVYGILEGISLGMGRGVVSRHLLANYSGVREVRGQPRVKNPVVLHFMAQPFYTALHDLVVRALSEQAARYLK